jgi:hypothetical protein
MKLPNAIRMPTLTYESETWLKNADSKLKFLRGVGIKSSTKIKRIKKMCM